MRADRVRPTLIYDGECGFCQRSVDLLRRWDREHRIALVPFQDQARVAAFNIPLPALAAAMHLVLPPPDGRVLSGADAVPELLQRLPGKGWLAWGFRIRACGPSRGVCTPGSRGDGTAWCGAQASARFRNRMAE